MEGVRILAEHAIYTSKDWLVTISAVCLFIGLISAFISALNWIDWNDPIWGVGMFIGLLLVALGVTCAKSWENSRTFSHTEYKVIVEDSVEFNEFLSHYEILDQEGEIYTVKEKSDVNELSQ